MTSQTNHRVGAAVAVRRTRRMKSTKYKAQSTDPGNANMLTAALVAYHCQNKRTVTCIP
jgi:hypothetical protein